MAALAHASVGCSSLALAAPIDLQFSQCSERGFVSRFRRRQKNPAKHVQAPIHMRSELSREAVGANGRYPVAEGATAEETLEQPLEKQHPSRRDLLMLTGALSVAIAQPARADDAATPPTEAPSAAPPAENQNAPPPPETQTPPDNPPAKPVETPSPADTAAAKEKQAPKPQGPNTTITARAYLDVMVCPGGTSRSDRTLGDSNNICTPESGGEMLGRIVIGLYGKQVGCLVTQETLRR